MVSRRPFEFPNPGKWSFDPLKNCLLRLKDVALQLFCIRMVYRYLQNRLTVGENENGPSTKAKFYFKINSKLQTRILDGLLNFRPLENGPSSPWKFFFGVERRSFAIRFEFEEIFINEMVLRGRKYGGLLNFGILNGKLSASNCSKTLLLVLRGWEIKIVLWDFQLLKNRKRWSCWEFSDFISGKYFYKLFSQLPNKTLNFVPWKMVLWGNLEVNRHAEIGNFDLNLYIF